MNLNERPRRLRRTDALRTLVRQVHLDAGNFILPMFVREGAIEPVAIGSMPGVVQHSQSSLAKAVNDAAAAGVGAVMLFGVPSTKDANGDAACDPHSILANAIRWTKAELGDAMPVIADLCLDEFTTHGHCGVLDAHGTVDNDATLAQYQRMSLTLADAGADILGLSGMMDGQVGAVREALDAAGSTDTVLLAYAAKFASAFYGPFRDAVESSLEGDRRSYQQDPANVTEAIREVRLDVAEGADIVMVKPGLPYLDIIARVANEVDVPVAAYVVSGESSMIEAAAAAGMIDRERAILETLTSVKRAGADIIATYWATEVAHLLNR
ncbi:MAG: porphobilinogen synthase [Actinomycetota bacterium]|nr:porphobilinogen synthase [Actinomycetota bacterium]MDP2289355.1 porphobilinogen synthase [Actinomycetota bacterium]